jgi:hypothetical protein
VPSINRIVLAFVVATLSLQAQDRPPAVPLVTNDPYFSIWSMNDHLTDGPTRHWTEAPQPMTGLLRIDGHPFRWMGVVHRRGLDDVPAMQQTSLEVTPLHTRYTFAQSGVQLKVTFFTPLFPNDLDVMSRPVTYLTWAASSTDGRPHKVDLLLDVDPVIAVNDPSQQVTWSRTRTEKLTLLNVGSRDQAVLNRSGDKIRIDWGYFHLATPSVDGDESALAFDALPAFVKGRPLPLEDDLAMPAPADNRGNSAHLAIAVPFGMVTSAPVEHHVLLAYTEGFAIEYLERKLRPYWKRNGMTDAQMLDAAESQYAGLDARGVQFDADLKRDMTTVGGADYAYLTALAFRQTIAAHKLVADVDGQPMLFSKENASNGCIDTVDVTYPSAPFFLLFNPDLLKAQLEPMMRYASLPRWKFPFAPHDLGTYPLANGQVYGGGELTEDDQMPVEESGDLILLIAAMSREQNDYAFAAKYFPELEKWADYLAAKGLDPENQLSTDDFAGHLAHNTNLSIKAIEALGAFAELAAHTDHPQLAHKYEALAKSLPARWEQMAREGDHTRLAFDQPGTWSQKYNLVWDDLLGLHLFPKSLARSESAFYRTKMQPYGLPLDSRKTITKLDWEIWTASLSTDPQQFAAIAAALRKWTNESQSRVPLTDFYDTVSGNQMAFQARSVVGGLFIKALYDPGIAKRWQTADAPGEK